GEALITALDGSEADLTDVTVTGGVKLEVADGDAEVAAGFELADSVDYTVAGGNVLDVTAADSLGGSSTTFTVETGSTLTATGEQLDGISVDGQGEVIVTDLDGIGSDLTSVDVDGGVTLDVADGDATVESDFQLVATGVVYTVAGDNTLDVTASETLGAETLVVEADTTLRANAAQLADDTVTGEGEVTLTDLDGSNDDLSAVTVEGGVTLDVAEADAAVDTSFTLAAGIDYTVAGGAELDVTAATALGADSVSVEAGSTLRATAEQLDGATVDGDGQVVVTDLEDPVDADLSGITAATTLVLTDNVALATDGRLPTAAVTLDGSYELDANAATDFDATSVEVPTGASLLATADQLDGVPVTGDGSVTVSGLDGATADLSEVAAGSVVLDTEGESATFEGTLADRTYEVVGDGSLDLTEATIDTTFELQADTDLVLLASQVGNDGGTQVTDTGTASVVTVEGLEDQPDADLSGIAVETLQAQVAVGGGVVLSGDLNGAELAITDTTEPSGTLEIADAGDVGSIDFNARDVDVLMTREQFDTLEGSTGGDNATVRFATEGASATWSGGSLDRVRLEDGSSPDFALNGLTDTIGEIQLDDATLRDMDLDFDGSTAVRVTNAEALESVSLTGNTDLEGTLILDSDQDLTLSEAESTSPGITAEGSAFTLRGEGAGAHRIQTGEQQRPLDVRDVTESVSLVAGAGGLTLEKTAGGDVPTVAVDTLDSLTLDSSQGDLDIIGAGGGSRTIGNEVDPVSVGNVELRLGDGDVSVTGGSFDVGTGSSLGVSGAGTATIERLSLDAEGGTYTVNVDDLNSHLVLEDASDISLGGGTLALDGGDDDAGQVSIGAEGALSLGNGTLDLSEYEVLGNTPGLSASLSTENDAFVSLGNAEQAFDLTGGGSFTFAADQGDNGEVSITGFDAGDTSGGEVLDFDAFEWDVNTADANGDGETFDDLMGSLDAQDDSWTLFDTNGEDALLTFTRDGDDVVVADGGDGGFDGEITLVGVADDLKEENFNFANNA
ncbi:MAG: beta strand repeat-containing protein, partial [Halomonas sp.]